MTVALHAQPELHQILLHQQSVALRQHMAACMAQRGRWALGAALAESAHAIVAPRFVTTVGVVAGLLAVGLGWV